MSQGLRFLALLVFALAIPACGGHKKRPLPAPAIPGSVIVTPTSGLITIETGGGATAQFTVVLGSAPSADVTIAVSSSNPAEGVPNQTLLTFTPANWNAVQTVVVSGVDDFVVDGDTGYTIILDPAVSADPNYAGIDPTDVTVTNQDDDVAGFVFSQTSGLVTTENGGTATFSVTLSSQPTADVSFDLSSDNTLEGTVSPTTLTFTAAAGPNAWNTAHTVTVTGVNDSAADGPVVYNVVTTVSTSTDANYNAKVVPDVTVTNNDNDTVGITATPTSGLVTSESGGTDTFTVVLNTQPTLDVVISVTSLTPAAGLVSSVGSPTPGSTLNLTFTNATWNVPQTVTLTGVNDANPTVNAAVAYTLRLDPSTSPEASYAALAAINLSASNLNDDIAGITVSKLSGLVTSEAGGQDTFTVRLDTVPSSPVTLTLVSSKPGEGTPSSATLVFLADASALNAQTVTLTGVNDFVIDGNVAYTITVAVDPATLDTNYTALAPIAVDAVNNDDDSPGYNLSKTSVITNESGLQDNFTVSLKSIPSATVTITLAVTTNAGEASVSPTTLTFLADATALNPKTVTVTGLDDAIVDGNVTYVITGTPSGSDPSYSGLVPFTINGVNNDNDVPAPPGAIGWVKTPGAALGTGSAPAWDDKSAQEPSVVKLGAASYVMWYEGANAAGQKHEQIGRATSSDGITWTKDSNPVFNHTGVNGTFDRNGVGDPTVIFDGSLYRMWYAGRDTAATKNKIGLATSSDGITWVRHAGNPVLLPTAGTFDSVGVSGPQVVYDAGTATYHMWFTGLDASGVSRIGHASSSDGAAWTKTTGAVLNTGSAGAFDASSTKLCGAILDGATYRMWYIGLDLTGPAGRQKLGFAQSSNGIAWTKFSGNPVLSAGAAGAFDEKNLWSPCVIKDGTVFRMWYGGENNGGTIRIGYSEIP